MKPHCRANSPHLLFTSRLIGVLLIFWALGWGNGAIAQLTSETVDAVLGLSCAGDRSGRNLGCTANDFQAMATIQAAPGTPDTCVAGEAFEFVAAIDLTSRAPDRYDVGFFAGESGNNPALKGGGTCSVATFPTTPLLFFSGGSNTCGDFKGSQSVRLTVQKIRVLCAGNSSGQLKVPWLLAYENSSGGTCSGPHNVQAASNAKCQTGEGSVQVGVDPLQVYGSLTVTKETDPPGMSDSFTFTASGTGTVPIEDQRFILSHGQSKRVRKVIADAARTLMISEGSKDFWESGAQISCTKPDGAAANFVTVDHATHTISAQLSNVNPNAVCTVENTQRSKMTLVKKIDSRIDASDQFRLRATGGAS